MKNVIKRRLLRCFASPHAGRDAFERVIDRTGNGALIG
jgi:hypothetical protein